VIGRDAVAHQPERRGEAVEDVDRQDDVALVEQRFGGVEPGGSSTDDGNA
jgi:hypothetical protein